MADSGTEELWLLEAEESSPPVAAVMRNTNTMKQPKALARISGTPKALLGLRGPFGPGAPAEPELTGTEEGTAEEVFSFRPTDFFRLLEPDSFT